MIAYFSAWALLLAVGMPVAFTLIVVSVAYLPATGDSLTFVPQRMVAGLNSFPFLAVPLFILAGHLMNTAGITTRIFEPLPLLP